MSSTSNDFIARFGLEAWRKRTRDAKRIARLRRRMLGLNSCGVPLPESTKPVVWHDGVAHPLSCTCYDCTFGVVAEWKRVAALPAGTVNEDPPRAARTGKVARAR